jgi:hypothetical protein
VSRVAARTRSALAVDELAEALRARLGNGEPTVLWSERGAEVLVHVDRLKAEIHEHGIAVRVPLEAEEAAGTVSIALALASGDESPDLVAAADEHAEGEALLAARWGPVLQDAVFAMLIALLEDAGAEEGRDAVGLRVRRGALELVLSVRSTR